LVEGARLMRAWRNALAGIGVFLYCEIGARVTLPGLNGDALARFLNNGGRTGGLSLYDLFVGDAVSLGALLALGVMPYIWARVMIWLASLASPAIGGVWRGDRVRGRRWTRALTISYSVIQSFGFARFVQSIPGVVSNPGVGFTVLTMSVLTAGAIITMELAERITRHSDDDDEVDGLASQPLVAPGDVDLAAFAAGSVMPPLQPALDPRERVL
jgi:preprotein translocase subunit SecY